MYVTSAGVYMYVYATDTGVYVPVCYCCRGVCICYVYVCMILMQGCMYMLLTQEAVTSVGVYVYATLYRVICMLPVQGSIIQPN